MKKRYLLGACAIPLVVWFAVPWLIRYTVWVFSNTIQECDGGITSQGCKDWMAVLGQSGDTFGVASALFSGLALFAVAATLWADYSARRSSRKPLLVCTIEESKEIVFDEPHHTEPRSIRLRASLCVRAANDTALNSSVKAVFSVGAFRLDLGEKYVQIPLLDGKSADLEFLQRINAEDIEALINEVAVAKNKMNLSVQARCNSIEGLSWKTSVIYNLSFKNSDIEKIKKMTHDEEILLEAWQGGAAVGLGYEIKPGSWAHEVAD